MDDGQGLGPDTEAPGQGPDTETGYSTKSTENHNHNHNHNHSNNNHQQPSAVANHYTWRVPPSHSLQLHAFVAALEQSARTRASSGADTETRAGPASQVGVGVVDTVWSCSSPNIYDALSHMYSPTAIATPANASNATATAANGTATGGATTGATGITAAVQDTTAAGAHANASTATAGAATTTTLLSPISSYQSRNLHAEEEEEEKKDSEPPPTSVAASLSSSLSFRTSTVLPLTTNTPTSTPTAPTSSSFTQAPLSLALATLRSSLSQSYRFSLLLLRSLQSPLCGYNCVDCDAIAIGLHQSYHILRMRLIEVLTRLGAFLLTQVVFPFLVVLAVVIGCRDVSYPKVRHSLRIAPSPSSSHIFNCPDL